jgi:hypothetical protein
LISSGSQSVAELEDSAKPHNEQTPLTMTLEHPGHSGAGGVFSGGSAASTGAIASLFARGFKRWPQFLQRFAPRTTSPPHSGHFGRWSGATAITSQPSGPKSIPQIAPANARPFAAPIIPPTTAAANQQRMRKSEEAAITIESLIQSFPARIVLVPMNPPSGWCKQSLAHTGSPCRVAEQITGSTHDNEEISSPDPFGWKEEVLPKGNVERT